MATYKADNVGMARYLKSKELREACRQRAEDGAKHARRIAPKVSREYASKIRVDTGFDLKKRDRVAAFIVAYAPYASVVEVGRKGSRRRGHRVLARTLDWLNSTGGE